LRLPSSKLAAIILAFGPVSGAHFNPVITLADRLLGGMETPLAAGYVVAQFSSAGLGVVVANLMFSLPALEVSTKSRNAPGVGMLL